jgi:hypothetical protein
VARFALEHRADGVVRRRGDVKSSPPPARRERTGEPVAREAGQEFGAIGEENRIRSGGDVLVGWPCRRTEGLVEFVRDGSLPGAGSIAGATIKEQRPRPWVVEPSDTQHR